MYKNITNRQGLTLLEFIIIIAIIGLIIVLGINEFAPGAKEEILNVREYGLRFSMNKTIKQIDQIIKYSGNIRALPRAFVANISRLDPSYSYIMVSSDGKRIMRMEHNGTEFIEKEILAKERKNIEYEIFFEKKSGTVNNVVRYEINVYIIDQKEDTDKRKIVFESSAEPIGISEVVDKGTGIPKKESKYASPSVALAYVQNR
jgi:hypothetical protein